MLTRIALSHRVQLGTAGSICVLFVCVLFPPTIDAQSFVPLFTPLDPIVAKKLDETAKAAIKLSSIRTRTVKAFTHMDLNSTAFQQLAVSKPAGTPLFEFKLPSPFSVPLSLFQAVDVRQEPDGRLIWRVEATYATGLLIVNPKERSIIGDISFGRVIYQIRPAGVQGHSIYLVDQSLFPRGHLGKIPPMSKAVDGDPQIAISTKYATFDTVGFLASDHASVKLISHGSGPVPVLDVMVLYTADAANELKPNDILDEIDIARARLVESFNTSGIHADVQVVSKRCISSYESGYLDSEVPQLRADPTVKTWRDAKDFADLVILWVKNAGNLCGATPDLGINTIPIPSSREKDAFSIVDAACATGNFSFAHELGHQMGLFHDRVTAGAASDFHWNYGFVSPLFTWKTIMAEDPEGCPPNEIDNPYCPRINAWSDGILGSRGVPIGTTMFGNTASGPANNADALSKSIPVAANFRVRPPGTNPIITSCVTDTSAPSAPTGLKVQ